MNELGVMLVMDDMAETCCVVDAVTLDIIGEWLDTRDDTVTQMMMYVDNNPEQRGTHWMTVDDWEEARKSK